jgi:type II secretory pathway component GspD/PulD (secretin)
MQPQVQNPRLVIIGGQTVPAPDTQTVQTIANVKDGDTIALGGLRTKRSSRGGSRIPVLSNIPFIGQFFKQNAKTDSDEDLIIFLTARILRRADDLAPVPGT